MVDVGVERGDIARAGALVRQTPGEALAVEAGAWDRGERGEALALCGEPQRGGRRYGRTIEPGAQLRGDAAGRRRGGTGKVVRHGGSVGLRPRTASRRPEP